MKRYQVMLTPDLEELFESIAEELSMSVDQVLTSALQIYAERLTLSTYDGFGNVEPMRKFEEAKHRSH